ncbi:MAG TPA: M20/M25/M40 family metallo-hydrolase [Bacteroidales bacterium]|nr:M20/M25/M40 family metallo-hydrolase [Bacteroidales bacterium]
MIRVTLLVFIAFLLFSPVSNGQKSPQEKGLEVITKEVIQAQLEFLASDWTEGRATGGKGIYLAGDYVASMFKYVGVQPAGDLQRGFNMRMRGGGRETPPAPTRSYFQNFTLLEPVPGGSSVLSVTSANREYFFQENVDFRVGSATASTKVSGPVVFIGYGIKNEDLGLDDFTNIDLHGKIVVRLSGYPGINDPESEMYKKINADRMVAFQLNRGKNQALEGKGIVAVIDINMDGSIANSFGEYMFDDNLAPNEGRSPGNWIRMSLDNPDLPDDPAIITVTPKVAKALMGSYNIAGYESDAAKNGYKFKPVPIAGTMAGLDIEVKVRRVRVRNVVAMIEGENPDEFVAVGAHMDHMGMAGGRIWNGADDNASGTVGVMTMARAFAATGIKPKRTILFCAWTGEEKGLLGSEYFTQNPSIGSIGQYRFYLNYDMISRDAANDTAKINVGVTYNRDYPYLEEISKKYAEEYGLKMNFNYRAQEKPTGGSDYTAFTNNNVPVIAVMAAMHDEYHTPADETSLVNWDKMLEIIKLGFLNLWDIANSGF